MWHEVSSDEKRAYSKKDINALLQELTAFVDTKLEIQNFKFLQRFHPLANYIRDYSKGKKKNFCKAGLNYLNVSTDGSLYLCHRFSENEGFKLGHLDKDVLNRKSFIDHRESLNNKCASCPIRNFCRGGCFHENWSDSKSETPNRSGISDRFCQIQKGLYDLAAKTYILEKEFEKSLRA